jgi:hypothetical protein
MEYVSVYQTVNMIPIRIQNTTKILLVLLVMVNGLCIQDSWRLKLGRLLSEFILYNKQMLCLTSHPFYD